MTKNTKPERINIYDPAYLGEVPEWAARCIEAVKALPPGASNDKITDALYAVYNSYDPHPFDFWTKDMGHTCKGCKKYMTRLEGVFAVGLYSGEVPYQDGFLSIDGDNYHFRCAPVEAQKEAMERHTYSV